MERCARCPTHTFTTADPTSPHPCAQAIRALQAAQDVPKAPLSDLFTDVYDQLPPHLEEQRAELFDFVARHPDACPPDIPVK